MFLVALTLTLSPRERESRHLVGNPSTIAKLLRHFRHFGLAINSSFRDSDFVIPEPAVPFFYIFNFLCELSRLCDGQFIPAASIR
ncbi:MAG: hypothetical protein DME44_08440 [Verrucomicrobia bacterium]|nr:MAG: hypothetical protein DME44_08440 [Verrucomicrobiota bacterium]